MHINVHYWSVTKFLHWNAVGSCGWFWLWKDFTNWLSSTECRQKKSEKRENKSKRSNNNNNNKNKKVGFKKLEQKTFCFFSCCCCCFVLFSIFIPSHRNVDIKRFAVAMQQLTISYILKSVSFTASKTIQQNYCIDFPRIQGVVINIWSNFLTIIICSGCVCPL